MTLRAGFGKGVVTPPVPVYLAGFGARTEPAREVHDDLEARALYLESDGAALCLVVCDLLGMSSEFSDPVRGAISSELHIPREAVLTACTHTHSGPSTIAGSGRLGWVIPDGYQEILVSGCLNAASGAKDAAEDAALAFGRFPLPEGLSHNRRGNPYDPWFAFLDVLRPDGSRIGVLANLAIHPVSLGPEWLAVSCDWVGPFRAHLEALAGGSTVMLSGALGDVNPRGWVSYEGPGGQFETTEALGKDLAAVVAAKLGSAEPVSGEVALAAARTVEAPTSPTPLVEMAGVSSITAELIEWSIGDVRLVSMPGEAFQAFGREVDSARGGRAILAGICPNWQGYFPYPWASGYEETVSYGEKVTIEILDALKEVP